MDSMNSILRAIPEGEREINIDNDDSIIEENRDREDTPVRLRFKIGTAILKVFDGTTFRGIITKRFDGMFYKITYSNGDRGNGS